MLNGRRLIVVAWLLLAVELASFVFFVAGTYGLIVPLTTPTTTDFVSFYAAGWLADSGAPQLAYDQIQHYVAEQRTTAAGIEYNFFYYPPVFMLLCAGLAHLPYLSAFAVFQAVSLSLYLLVASRIINRGRAAILLLLAFPPVLWNIGIGQNASLTAALFGAATLLVDRRPVVSGLFFGALCYKPHFALLVPLALAVGRHWRALAAAGGSAMFLCLLSLLLFGWQTWHDFIVAAAASHSVYESGRVTLAAFVTPFGGLRMLGGSPSLAYTAQAVVTSVAGLLVAVVWRRNLPLPLRAATLISATLVAVPVALFYDLMLAGIAGLWLLLAAGAYRLGERGKALLGLLFVLSLDPRGMSQALHIPVGAVITLSLFGLTASAALRGARAIEAASFAEG